jgi:Domain of unknown function (DUF4145)
MTWMAINNSSAPNDKFECGHCGAVTATAQTIVSFLSTGFTPQADPDRLIRVCTSCGAPTYFAPNLQIPAPQIARDVEHLPPAVKAAYDEARRSFAASAPTAAALMCRKILMNIAVAKGAPENERFVTYVDFLAKNRHVPPGSDDWVEHIKDRGNHATHEIVPTTVDEGRELVMFTQSLLHFAFELPGQMRAKGPRPAHPSHPRKGK